MNMSALIQRGTSIRRPSVPICIHRTVSSSAALWKAAKPKQNHYQVLGIKKNASTKEIRDAFLKMSKSFHPDMNSENTYNHDKFVKVNEAYSVLSKPLSRRDYDQSLIQQRSSNVSHQQYRRTTGSRPHRQQTNDSYHYYSQFHASYQDMSQEAAQSSQPVKKIPNRILVSICLGIFLVGGLVQFYIAYTLNDIGKERSDRVLENAQKAIIDEDYTERLKRMKEKMMKMKADERDKFD